jgi:hypothetical protein
MVLALWNGFSEMRRLREVARCRAQETGLSFNKRQFTTLIQRSCSLFVIQIASE